MAKKPAGKTGLSLNPFYNTFSLLDAAGKKIRGATEPKKKPK